MKKIKKITNYVIIDSAAGLSEESKSTIQACDEIIIITNPELPAVTDALKTIKLSEEKNKPIKGVIITRCLRKRPEMSIANIKDMLEVPILGIIPEDISIKESQAMKNAVIYTHPRSKAAKAYIDISKKILGKTSLEQKPGLINRFLKIIGLK